MTGLELAENYWKDEGLPLFRRELPVLLEHAAFGLVGEGSECLGFDDRISRDHDWGPGFCIWIDEGDMPSLGNAAASLYASLPQEYLGFRRLRPDPMSAGRTGVIVTGDFYRRFLGIDHVPRTLPEWRSLPEDGLAMVTNGKIFLDVPGTFTALREGFLGYYPEDVRLKRLAAACAKAAQSGQYNCARCLRRGDTVPATLALARFIDEIQAAAFLLNKRYRPYYKWSQRALRELPLLGPPLSALLEQLTEADWQARLRLIEESSMLIIKELILEGLSAGESDFLLDHAKEIQEKIQDPVLRCVHLMAE